MRWVGEEDYDRVAETRMLCYAAKSTELDRYKEGVRSDPRCRPGDILLAEDGSGAVGTATSLSLTMWVRGSPFPCQGIADVGTIQTHRRGAGGARAGIASQVMHEALKRGRGRGEVLSALMPFRASFYEHFGYGVVERRCSWTVPLDVMPPGACEGFRMLRDEDLPMLQAARNRIVQAGQCDIERSPATWQKDLRFARDGFVVVDFDGGQVRGWIMFARIPQAGKDILRVTEMQYERTEGLLRQLRFMGSLRDQYHAAALILPTDVPLHWLLRERQIPHRPVNHLTADPKPFTRMQVRVLDHKKLLAGIHLPPEARGQVVMAVRETEGHVEKFRIEIASGRAVATASEAAADVECPDVVWSAIALGDLAASQAAEMGLVGVNDRRVLPVLDALAAGRAPFTHEYF